ncbi:MAG: FeoB small GTPase domain-containing protein [Xenococcaceae cyanobacterium MO_188.B32]|nr:FeoB small GTPase domain-containing protein [Xenococcaceae cyanobacterium MO_188.B32]
MNCHQCPKNNCTNQKSPGWWKLFRKTPRALELSSQDAQIALVGMPNVGKSVLFNRLTGIYVTVSNYPGTTVEVSRGLAQIGEQNVLVIDTPGMYSLVPISDEERVARDLLLKTSLTAVIQVVDAKNLGRMLPLTFQLIEAGLPLLLAVNMMDEAHRLGLKVQQKALAVELGIPVILTSAALNQGIDELKSALAKCLPSERVAIPA